MTLKEYLEKQIAHFAKAKQESKEDDPMYYQFKGQLLAYTDILLTCPYSVLNKKVLDEVW